MRRILFFLLFCSLTGPAFGDTFDDLAREFWTWRAGHQPLSGDDIPRIERPEGWLPDWSPSTVESRSKKIREFHDRWRTLDSSGWPVEKQVDYWLIGSAIARVDWELNVLQGWRKNPVFYLEQSLGSVFEALLQPPPFDEKRSRDIQARIDQIPVTLRDAQANLDAPIKTFAALALQQIADLGPKFAKAMEALQPELKGIESGNFGVSVLKASTALGAFQSYLRSRYGSMDPNFSAGREAYQFFLRNVALIPYEPEDLVQMARQELNRAIAFEAYEKTRNQGLPELPVFANAEEQIRRESEQEQQIRRFLEEKGILTVPPSVRHYRNLPIPSYLEPLASLGVSDDLTGPSRTDEDGISYIFPPSSSLPYFPLSTAKDPRPIIIHEGVPGHYFQLVLGWLHENPIRRHYYDSVANEGIGFYAEEMMLQQGLFDDSPRTREIIYNFMRLRALRVEVDVKLALGEFSLGDAARYLEQNVPMDRATAEWEAAFFASQPGQAISYQVGKLQIIDFLAEARRLKGDGFSLKEFHDYLWKNGNVPITLQRWEFLGLSDEIEKLQGVKPAEQ